MRKKWLNMKEGNVLFNDALNTFYLRLYGVRHMVKDHSDNERGNPLPPHSYSFRLAARVLSYAPSHRQDSTYHGLCYTSCGALAGTRNSSMGPAHEGSIRRPIAPWAKAKHEVSGMILFKRMKKECLTTPQHKNNRLLGVKQTFMWLNNWLWCSDCVIVSDSFTKSSRKAIWVTVTSCFPQAVKR